MTGTPQHGGIGFGPTPNDKMYLSMNQHRHWAQATRNRWAATCPPQGEYEIFVAADVGDWADSRPHLWGLQAGLLAIGADQERIALFRSPTNDPDPWHGYPVSALDTGRETEHRPEPALVDRWISLGLIDEQQGNRINRGKV